MRHCWSHRCWLCDQTPCPTSDWASRACLRVRVAPVCPRARAVLSSRGAHSPRALCGAAWLLRRADVAAAVTELSGDRQRDVKEFAARAVLAGAATEGAAGGPEIAGGVPVSGGSGGGGGGGGGGAGEGAGGGVSVASGTGTSGARAGDPTGAGGSTSAPAVAGEVAAGGDRLLVAVTSDAAAGVAVAPPPPPVAAGDRSVGGAEAADVAALVAVAAVVPAPAFVSSGESAGAERVGGMGDSV